MNPVWFSTVALVRFLLGRVSDGLRGDEMDGWIVASESSPPKVHLYADETSISLCDQIF